MTGTTRLTRADVLRLGATARPWDFLPIADQALAVAPRDDQVRALAAAHYARLGLRTPAAEHLALVAESLRASGPISRLIDAVARLPDDAIPHDRVRATCRANLSAVRGMPPSLAAAAEDWCDGPRGLGSFDWFRTTDGHVVRRLAHARDPMASSGARPPWTGPGAPTSPAPVPGPRPRTGWIGWGPHRDAADRFITAQWSGDDPAAKRHLCIVEGLDPPWLAGLVADRTRPASDAFSPRVILVQAEPVDALAGLSTADLSELLGRDATTLLIGPGASQELAAFLASVSACSLQGPCFMLASARRCAPTVEAVLASARAAQIAEHDRLSARAASLYAGRDAAWWRGRFEDALAEGSPRPLRVLIPTSRYSTFVRHSSADLAEAFAAAGATAEVLVEPDPSSQLASVAYLRRIVELEPDLVVLINYPRTTVGAFFPPELPWVTWIQDAMPHQAGPGVGAALSANDFVVGHMHKELFDQAGYPRARTLPMPVVAASRKFHAGPITPAQANRFGAEIAFVSHHAEPPDDLHRRLVLEAGDAATRAVLETLRPAVERLVAASGDVMGVSLAAAIEKASAAALARVHGRDPDPRQVTQVHRHYALRMADRLLRHGVLAEAHEIARRRGWRLAIYGRGWASHPRFGELSRGEIDHGDDLRACYQAAAVHLHVSAQTLVHQRVMECAMSGGLPLCRLHFDGLAPVRGRARFIAARELTPAHERDDGCVGYDVADHPVLADCVAQHQRLGVALGPVIWMPAWQAERFRTDAAEPAGDPLHAAWLMGDLAETTFRTAAELESLVEFALARAAWRRGVGAGIARRARDHASADALVGRLADLLRASYRDAAGRDERVAAAGERTTAPERPAERAA